MTRGQESYVDPGGKPAGGYPYQSRGHYDQSSTL